VLPIQSVFKNACNHRSYVFRRLQIINYLLLLVSVDFWIAEILKPSMCWSKCIVKCIPYNIYCYSACQRNHYVKPKKKVALFKDAVSCYCITPVEDELSFVINVSCNGSDRRILKCHVFNHKTHIDWPRIEPLRICDENNNETVSFQRALRFMLPVSPQTTPHIRIFPTTVNATPPGNISPCWLNRKTFKGIRKALVLLIFH